MIRDCSVSGKLRLFCLLVILFVLTSMGPPDVAESHGRVTELSFHQAPATQQPTAEQVYKNIPLFKGMPASEL